MRYLVVRRGVALVRNDMTFDELIGSIKSEARYYQPIDEAEHFDLMEVSMSDIVPQEPSRF